MLSRWTALFGTNLRAAFLTILFFAPLFGIDRDLRIDQLYHTAWTRKDGAPTQIKALAQTTDGFLWIGDRTGLYRFDGLTFELYQPPAGQSLPKVEVDQLLATPDGGLWIGLLGGVSLLKDGKITTFPDTQESQFALATDMARDADGAIWRAGGLGGLTRFDGTRWEAIGSAWDFNGIAQHLYVDRAGTLWVDGGWSLSYLPKGSRKFQKTSKNTYGYHAPFVELQNGTMWLVEHTFDGSQQVGPIASGPILREIDPKARVSNMIVDEQGSLWIGTEGHGINRTQYPERADGKNTAEANNTADIYRQKDGLSGDVVRALLEDREGDVWAATNGGLDRFRQSPLITIKFPPDSQGFSLTARDKGEVWVTSLLGQDDFIEIRDGKRVVKPRLAPVRSSYRDPDGVIWLGTQDGIFRFVKDQSEQIDFQREATAITEDGGGKLVALFVSGGLVRREHGAVWTNLGILGLPEQGGLTAVTDSSGRVWEGFTNNRVAQIDENKAHIFTGKEGVTAGNITTIRSGNGSVWIGGDAGLERFDGHRFVPVAPADGTAFRDITGIVATAEDGIWFGEARGIVHIAEAETRRAEQDPEYRVEYQAFDILDGLSGALQPNDSQPNMIQGTDGRLWFATTQGVVWLDPKRVSKEPLPPAVAILSLTASGRTYRFPEPAPVVLPAHPVNLHFAYTAPSLAIPERVRFRYRLEGLENDWTDGGVRREVDYTSLGPGSYRLHVMASNREGVWNGAEAVMAFSIQPTFIQTAWFDVLCTFAAGSILWGLYRLRLRQMSARLSAQMQVRLEERLAERERIARELHDTLLQGFQGLTLHFQAVMEQIPDEEPARQKMKKALTYADGVLLEGRKRVRDLRSDSAQTNQLPQQIADYGAELTSDRAIGFKVTVVGSPQPLHPIAGDEVYRIAREALANAFRHSRASQIEVEITYDAASCCVRIRDNGAGIGPEILNTGKQGHWGLSGMRERAQKIGAKLSILSNPGSGTEIDLALPASLAYSTQPKRRPWYWITREAGGGR